MRRDSSETRLENVLAEIQTRIKEGRARGDYPPGLEQQLEWEFQHLVEATKRREIVSGLLGEQIKNLDQCLESSQHKDEATHRLRDIVKILGQIAGDAEDADRRLVQELNQHIMDRISVVDHLAILMVELERRIVRLEDSSEDSERA